ncbi:MAG: ABC transporter permease [Lachnospiraceae bacterium]|nr:ABC transporter permease [Candidatus Darwinimomas equi]
MNKEQSKKKVNMQLIITLGVMVALFILFTILRPAYAGFTNIMSVLLSTCVNGCLSFGVTFVIISGGIDLSIGPVMTLTGVVSGVALTKWGLPLACCIPLGLLVGVLCGVLNGIMVAKMKLAPFIATLAMQMIVKGLNLVISGLMPVYFTSDPFYQKIALGNVFGIEGFYSAIIVFIGVCVLAYLILHKTLLGRYTYAIGSNREAARLSGIKVDKWTIVIYALSSLFAGFAGLIMTSRLNSAQPQLGPGYETEAIAASVIGGTSMAGGEGSILGVIIGVIIISELSNGLRVMAVSQEWQSVIIGAVLVASVYFDQLRNKKKA